MRSYSLPFFAILTILAVFGPAFGTDYYVNVNAGSNHNSGRSPDDAWKSITWALERGVSASQDNPAVLHIAAGTYTPASESFPLIPPSYTSLMGANPEEVVIDAQGTAQVFDLHCVERVVLSGLTITGGDSYWGGGIYMRCCDACRVENCAIRGNKSTFGGGLGTECGVSMDSSLDGFGGILELTDCIICDNYATRAGGGVHAFSDVKVRATRCLICSNVSPQAAGICIILASFQLVDSVVAKNIAEREGEYRSVGAGLCVPHYSGRLELDAENCLFISNTNPYGPGGAGFIGLHGQGIGARFSGCTFISNTALDGGPALQVEIYKDYSLPAVEVTDCIFRDGGDEIWEQKAGLVLLNNSCVEGGWQGSGQNNFDADPLFVSGPFSDYYLSQRAAGQQQDSPCVDAGSMTAAEAGMAAKTTRTDGMPDTGVVDIGFHYPMLFMMPQVSVSTPSDTYSHGDTLEVVFEAINLNPFSYSVDLYAAIIAADGVIWTIDASWVWSASLNPWFASLDLPPGFRFGPTTLLTIELPSASPPVSAPGTYWVAAAFAHVGTTTFIGQPSLSAFELIGD